MLATCATYGITPLTREEFEQEDKRIYVEAVARRSGLSNYQAFVAPLNFYS